MISAVLKCRKACIKTNFQKIQFVLDNIKYDKINKLKSLYCCSCNHKNRIKSINSNPIVQCHVPFKEIRLIDLTHWCMCNIILHLNIGVRWFTTTACNFSIFFSIFVIIRDSEDLIFSSLLQFINTDINIYSSLTSSYITFVWYHLNKLLTMYLLYFSD